MFDEVGCSYPKVSLPAFIVPKGMRQGENLQLIQSLSTGRQKMAKVNLSLPCTAKVINNFWIL